MKKKLLAAILGLTIVLFAVSCSKSDATVATSTEGKWIGNYNNGTGGPIYYFALHFESGGVLGVEANSAGTPDLATGTWTIVGDSVRATYRYLAGTMSTYSLAGRYSSNSNVMIGTLGIGASTSGAAVFTVTKQ